jgi:hypothetical protein
LNNFEDCFGSRRCIAEQCDKMEYLYC